MSLSEQDQESQEQQQQTESQLENEKVEETEVFAVGWDISLGLSETKIGKLFLWATSPCENTVPQSIDHVGIQAFGHVYEYGDCGILRSKIPKEGFPPSKYPTFALRAVEKMGTTKKTRKEFEDWICEQNRSNFKGCDYDVVNHNCIKWATLATKFLDVDYPSNWDLIVSYAKKNKLIASAVGQSVMHSRQANFVPFGTFE